jgi:IS1 family transposase
VAAASGQHDDALIGLALRQTAARTGWRAVTYVCDGWRSYPTLVRRLYQQPVHTGRPGRPCLVVPDGLAVAQTRKVRRPGGRVVRVEQHAALGSPAPGPPTVHVERLNGGLRDRLACLGRKTHAFAKCVGTWRALVGVALFWHNWLRAHPALRTPSTTPGRRYDRRSPAMALGLTDHVWSWEELFRIPVVISR